MSGLDELIAGMSQGGAPLLVVLLVAVLLGLRHATDPDHLVAVSALVAADSDSPLRRATRLGLSWGLGHASTLLLLGLPIALFGSYLPSGLQRAAEVLVGIVIMALAVRLLARWRRGRFHVHEHEHGGLRHRHLHRHDRDHAGAHRHDHDHAPAFVRSSVQAYAVGLVHGAAGSAAVGVLLLASIQDRLAALSALVVFAAATAASMAWVSSVLGYVLARGPVRRRFVGAAPLLGGVSLAFGAWYALGAVL